MHESLETFGLEPLRDFNFYKGDMSFMIRGTEVMMRSADDPQRLRGLNLSWFALDEAREFANVEVFNVLIGRLRQSEADQWAVSSTTKGRNWFWQIIHDAHLDSAFETGYAASDKLSVIIQSSQENSFLPQAYLDELTARYSSQVAKQELEGKIVDFSAGVFRESWFQNRDLPWTPKIGVRAWDVASTVNTMSDYSAGVLMARHADGHWNIVDVIRRKSLYPKDLILETALRDGPGVTVVVETVGMQNTIFNDLLAEPRLAGYKVKAFKTTRNLGDKLTRALPLAGRLEQGVLRLCNGAWNTAFVEEMVGFDGTGATNDDQVDGASMSWHMLNRAPVFKQPKDEQYKCTDAEKKDFQKLASVELAGYVAVVLRAAWHPHKEILQIADESRHDTVDGIAKAIKPCVRRLGCETLDSSEYKTINAALIKAGASVTTGKLDVPGAVYWANRMIDQGKIYMPKALRTYAELVACEPDADMPPEVLCLLRIVAEVRSWVKPPEKEYKPFEKQRNQFKAQTDERIRREQQDPQLKEWVN